MFREPSDIWWISNVYKGSSKMKVEFVIDPNDDEMKSGIYELNVYNMQVRKIK
jgi:hypothetical protein